LRASDKVLEIGTGCGYQAAVWLVAKDVFTIERRPELASGASPGLLGWAIRTRTFIAAMNPGDSGICSVRRNPRRAAAAKQFQAAPPQLAETGG